MLKQRVLTALPLAAFIIWGIFTQPVSIIFYALLLITAIAGWEWSALSGISNKALRAGYALSVAALAYASHHIIERYPQWLSLVLLATVVLWLMAIFHMFTRGPQDANQLFSKTKFLLGFAFLIPPVLALLLIRKQPEGEIWLFYCLSIVSFADIGAYFAGKRFGKTKLVPKISPGKTREGLYGGVFVTASVSVLAGLYFELQAIPMVMLLIITVLSTFVSVAGDLFVSLLKRERGLKDTGHILPGHGGILDRIDSIISSAPFIAFLLSVVIF
ncbi:Phosphatidate cytidylyltransferase [hydrothermal vent metagenome]|uniref:Phosphatidate cytidylyltransferase n=1 Tax=hydrothermal vent metagenome TaxID=652676 RepID=A0A3B0YES2_9ZZZZ